MVRTLSTPRLFVTSSPRPLPGMWGDLTLTSRWPYGCWEATWTQVLKPYQRVRELAVDTPVEARLGSGPIWAGNMAEPDWDSGKMTAVGAVRDGETSLCLTAAGDTTATPDLAIDQAIARGAVSWVRRASLSAVPFAASDSTAAPNYLTALIDAWSSAAGARWAVNARREVYAATDPTVPDLYIRPGAGVLGVTEESLAARIVGRYQTTSGAYASVSVGSGVPEVGVLLDNYGPLDPTTATNIITGMRIQLQARTTWTNGLTITRDQVTTPSGQTLGLDQVLAGKMARLLGLRDERGAAASTDIVIGESIWDVSAGTVQVNPVGLSDRSLSGVVEAAGGTLL